MCSQKRSICDKKKKCLQCHKVYGRDNRKITPGGDWRSPRYNHKCGFGKCYNCEKTVEIASHRCYIRLVRPDNDKPKLKEVTTRSASTRPVVRVDEDSE